MKFSEEFLNKAKTILSTDIRYIKGVGPNLAQILYKKNIFTVEDALFYLPKTYENRANIKKIEELFEGEKAVVIGKIVKKEEIITGSGKVIWKFIVSDDTGFLECVWFSKTNYMDIFYQGEEVAVFGEVKAFRRTFQTYHPKIVKKEKIDEMKIGKLVPIYVASDMYENSIISRVIRKILENHREIIISLIPERIEKEKGIISLQEAFLKVHIPEKYASGVEEIQEARKRILFEELFRTQVSLFIKRSEVNLKKAPQIFISDSLINFLLSTLPFKPTSAQLRAIEEIRKDLAGPRPMYRLLQGDVGSGKTLVAFCASFMVCSCGYQSIVMSPTEILARQLYENFQNLGKALGLSIALITGSTKKSDRKEIYEKLNSGKLNILVGTHALIYDDEIKPKKPGLIVIDEQHRFGVLQRLSLINKGEDTFPHILVMTATPIPRTVALTVWGDLDISVLDEFPPGKKPVKTKVFRESEKFIVWEEIEKELRSGGKVFVVYPLLKESEKLDIPSAEGMYKTLSERFSKFGVGLLHGKMSGERKNEIIKSFLNGQVSLLVSTTVIEVGIDIPDATMIVIEHAERFGLSQLHQLRGRVGRRDKEGTCILIIPDNLSENSEKRIRLLEREQDGFKIAEADLEMRGPGDILGTRQHGFSDIKIEVLKDTKLISFAREIAKTVVFEPILDTEEKLEFERKFSVFLGDKSNLVISG